MRREKIATYNAWKGIGSVGILFSHMSYLREAANPFWKNFYSVFMSKGAICCTLFVLFSGYFLDYAWQNRDFKDYIFGKLKRIYPLTFFVFLAALAVDLLLTGNNVVNEVAVGSKEWYFNIFANLFLFKAFIPRESVFYSFHGPSWYISVLFGFYLIAYPFVNGIHGNKPEKWLKRIQRICIAAYSIELLICILVRIQGWNSLCLCYVNPWFRIFGEGFAGILLCEYMGIIQKSIKDVDRLEIWACIFFVGAFLIRKYHLLILRAWFQVIPMGLVLVAFYSGYGRISRFLKHKPIQFLGKISFELYMTHAFVYEGLPIVIGAVNRSMKTWIIIHSGIRFIITFFICIFAAWIVHIIMAFINKNIVYRN